jgi:hypothetical protein
MGLHEIVGNGSRYREEYGTAESTFSGRLQLPRTGLARRELWVSYYTSADDATEGGSYLVPTEIRLAKVDLTPKSGRPIR